MRLVAQTSLESSLAQHIFSSFVWAIAKHVPAKAFKKRNENSILRGDLFRVDDPGTLLSLRLQNNTIAGMASSIQQTGLGGLQEVYTCLIPPLSTFQKLPAEAMIEFVRRQMREHEILGHWVAVVPGYIRLFRECKSFGPRHRVFHLASAMLIDIFRYVSNTLELRKSQKRTDGIDELTRKKDEIAQELQLDTSPPCDFMEKFLQLISLQLRPKQSPWMEFEPEARRSKNVHDFFNHDPIFSKIITPRGPERGPESLKRDPERYPEKDSRFTISDIGSKDTNATDIFGWTPLHYATARGDEDVMKRLLTVGADPNARDLAEWTPLHYAIEASTRGGAISEEKLETIIWTLLQNGADTEIRGRDGIGPIHCAATAENASVRVLLQAGANPQMQDNSRKTPLHWAAFSGNANATKELLGKGVYRGAQDDYGRIPLHLAAVAGRREAAEMLLESEQDGRGAVDRDGRTPLHLAAITGDRDMVHLLLGGNCHGEAKKHQGTTNKYADRHDVLDCKDNMGFTPLDLAIIFGKEDAMRVLLDDTGEMGLQMLKGFTVAVLFARPKMVQLIGSRLHGEAIEDGLRIAMYM